MKLNEQLYTGTIIENNLIKIAKEQRICYTKRENNRKSNKQKVVCFFFANKQQKGGLKFYFCLFFLIK